MGISLTDHERGAPFQGDYGAALAEVQERLAQLQLAQVVHEGRAIILLEGWEGSGKRESLRLLAGSLDPCRASFHCPNAGDVDVGRHWLAPYWSRLPRAGETAVFLRGWYARAVEARIRGESGDKQWSRAFDEINEFEAQQTDQGTLIVKLFFHVGEAVQARRLKQRAADPWLRWIMADEGRSLASRRDYLQAWEGMFERSNTRWAGWTVIDAGDRQAANVAALDAVADALARSVPVEPPATGRVVGMAADASA